MSLFCVWRHKRHWEREKKTFMSPAVYHVSRYTKWFKWDSFFLLHVSRALYNTPLREREPVGCMGPPWPPREPL